MPTLVANVRVFDGERVADANSVLWEGARITAVGRDLPAPDRGEVIDARGKTLLPGLIDAHVHTPDALDRAEAALGQSLESGVTTALCMGTFTPETVAELKARDRTDLADLRSAGNPATVRGSHPSQLYPGDYPHALRHVAEVPPFIANRLREGSDYIKIMIEDSSLIGGNTPRMSPELSRAVTSEAHAHGLLVIAHAQTRGFVEQALESGVDGLAHQFVDQPLTADFARLLGDAGVFVVPTLAVYHSAEGRTIAADPRLAAHVRNDWLGTLRTTEHGQERFQRHALDAIRTLREAGVPILAGSDAADVGNPGVTYGASIHHELALLVRGGLPPAEALAAATSVPAEHFRLTDRGRIRDGLRPDLLLVDGDPTTDITTTRNISAVWRNGTRRGTGEEP